MRTFENGGRRRSNTPASAAALALVAGTAFFATLRGADSSLPLRFLVANNDSAASFPASTVSFYGIGSNGGLEGPANVSTGGNGMAGGFFGISRVLVATVSSETCVFASNAQSESIAGIDAASRKLAGAFRGSRADNKLARDGIGLAVSGDYLYASFSGAGNLGTFRIQSGCRLQFVADLHVQGLGGGFAEGIAANGSQLVAAYGDGSVESFDIAGGAPVSRDDKRFAADPHGDLAPGSVDISRDGQYAIFGGGAAASAVQVAALGSGKLGPAVTYPLGRAGNSACIRLSPDERVLYVSNSAEGRVTAAFFDRSTGRVRPGCTSAPLRGFYRKFTYLGGVATELATGAGGLLYVPEFDAGGRSAIGLLRLALNGAGCTLAEAANSPVAGNTKTAAVLSIGVFPPRPF